MGLIFWLSAQPGDAVAGQDDELWEILRNAAHIAFYAVLAVLIRRALVPAGIRSPAVTAFVVTMLYALSDELHQHFVPGRTASVFDLALDAVGALAGLAVAVRLARWPEVASRTP